MIKENFQLILSFFSQSVQFMLVSKLLPASKTVKEQLTINSQDPLVFQCLLSYMYTGTVVIDRGNVTELLRLANKLLIGKLHWSMFMTH